MKGRLLILLGVEQGEESMVSMLLTQSVFLGIFFGAFDISAHSLFLSVFDEKMMARGYVVSGFAGIILTSLYTWLQTRMKFRNFAIWNLSFVTAFTLLLWILLVLYPSKVITFLVFIMLGPLNILAALGFWGTAGRLFTLRQGKRLFGLVDAGLIIGIIISCYAIPVLLAFNFRANNILLISSGSVLIGSIIQALIGGRFQLVGEKPEEPAESVETEKRSILAVFKEDSYIRIMGLFIALSVMTAFFVQYSFMAVTREQYPSEADMANFLGLFTGSMMIFTLLIKILVFSYLIRNYGLRTCLSLTPVLLVAFTIIAILIGLLMGFTPATSGFMLFFMLLALSRLFSKSLKDSIESPSFKVIYQTIDEKIRYGIQSGMDGTVNEISALTSGLILAGLGILSFIKLIHFSIVLVVISAAWVYIAIKLYSEYRNSIRKALEPGDADTTHTATIYENTEFGNSLSTRIAFQNDLFNLTTGSLKPLEVSRNESYYDQLLSYAESTKDFCVLPAVRKLISDQGKYSSRATLIAESLELSQADKGEGDDKISRTRKLLTGTRVPQTTEILRLLRDNSAESKKLAIYLIGKFKLKDLLPDVCDCLNTPGLEIQAINVLKSFGTEASPELIRYFMSSSGNQRISKTIINLLGPVNSPENQAFLFSRLWSGSRSQRELSLGYLVKNNFKPSDEDRDRLLQLISDTIGIIVWIISSRAALQKMNEPLVLKALNREYQRWNSFLFGILSIAYEPSSIDRIRENIENNSVESVNFALEMIDIVIDDSIKPKLVPVVDAIPDEDKIKALFQFYPGEVPGREQLTESIINRDYNLLGLWIRACMLRNMDSLGSEGITESVLALTFSPEQLLREESIRLIERTDKDLFISVSARLPEYLRKNLKNITGGDVVQGDLLYEKILFSSQVFTEWDEEYLIPLATLIGYASNAREIIEMVTGDCLVWGIHGNKGDIASELASDPKQSKILTGERKYDHYYFIPLRTIEKFLTDYPEFTVDLLAYAERNQ